MAAQYGALSRAAVKPVHKKGPPRRGDVKAAIARSMVSSITSMVHSARSSLSRQSFRRTFSWSSSN